MFQCACPDVGDEDMWVTVGIAPFSLYLGTRWSVCLAFKFPADLRLGKSYVVSGGSDAQDLDASGKVMTSIICCRL